MVEGLLGRLYRQSLFARKPLQLSILHAAFVIELDTQAGVTRLSLQPRVLRLSEVVTLRLKAY